jgi:inorganic triphosphatase YgiF
MAASLEVELKLRAESDAPLRVLAAVDRLGPAELGPATHAVEVDRYLDTADGRLAAAGWACRLRRRDSSTRISLKGPAQHLAGASLHSRPEVEGPVSEDEPIERWPASAALDRLMELSGGAPLAERLTLRQRRTERAVRLDGTRVGLLTLDRVQVEQHGRRRGSFLAVELELDPSALERGLQPTDLAAALLAVPGLREEPHTKLERALGVLGVGAA